MSYTPRLLVPHCPHHVVQRGNKRETVFGAKGDYELYVELLEEAARRHGVAVAAYCLMPNHVHLLLVPSDADGIPRTMHRVAQRFARRVNAARGWSGHLWEKRYYSAPMDEAHLRAAVRYVLSNPVRAGLADDLTEWPFSSARTHLGLVSQPIVSPYLDAVVGDWRAFLSSELRGELRLYDELRQAVSRVAVGHGSRAPQAPAL